jgi:hypothetical protein
LTGTAQSTADQNPRFINAMSSFTTLVLAKSSAIEIMCQLRKLASSSDLLGLLLFPL